jgi:Na+/melibiose symporter-like transporter
MKLVAPLAGAGLYAWRGPVPVVLMCAIMPLLTAACYALLRIRPAAGAPAASSGRGALAGLPGAGALAASSGRGALAGLAVLMRPARVRVPVLVAAVSIAMSGLTGAAVLARVVHGLHLPATHLGLLASAQGAGSIAGGLLVGRLLARLGPARVAALGAALFAAGCVAWCLPWWPAMIAGSGVVGLGLPWTLIAGITAVQTSTPDHLLGRAGATANMAMFGPVAVAIPLGSVSVQAGAGLTLVTAAAIALGVAVFAARSRAGGARERAAAAEPGDAFGCAERGGRVG